MKRLIIITGASRGIGKGIATELNRFYNADTHFLLIARDVEKLSEVRDQLEKDSNRRNTVKVVSVDFSIPNPVDVYYKILKVALLGADLTNEDEENEKLRQFEQLIVVYNHGTLIFGNVSLVMSHHQEMRDNFETNLFSIWTMLAAVNLLLPVNIVEKQFHVNISSGYALEACANWSGHCCARSARNMLFKCFALENPKLRVLNYEPGIVKTDMLKQACEVTTEFQEGYESGLIKFIEPEATARRLIEILEEDKFVSGSQLKYN